MLSKKGCINFHSAAKSNHTQRTSAATQSPRELSVGKAPQLRGPSESSLSKNKREREREKSSLSKASKHFLASFKYNKYDLTLP